ncbi:MAG TPA: SIS domain-containing protein [Candidatus Acidoferrales bacterium]|nr:SIS domain-containing protein [Candidatus Acidoferrales bacterium]
MSATVASAPPVAERTGHPFLTYDMIQEIPDAIGKTIENSASRIRSITDRVKGRPHCYFTGCGTAFFSAMLGSNMFSLMEDNASKFEYSQALELGNYHNIVSDSVVFGVSHSGITKTTVDALRAVKSRSGYAVGVTHFNDRPISEVADETIVVGNGPDKSRCHTKCYPAGALPLTLLALDLLEQGHSVEANRLHTIRKELEEMPRLANSVLSSTETTMKELAETYYDKRAVYFAGTGGSCANALEAALKIMETSYLPAQGFETEQLLHGPWCSLDERSILFVMSTERSMYERNADCVRAASSLGATVIPLVFEGDRDIAGMSRDVIRLPIVDEKLAAYLSIIPLYLFAYYLSVRLGNNPDYLRYLTPTYWNARTIIFPPGTH